MPLHEARGERGDRGARILDCIGKGMHLEVTGRSVREALAAEEQPLALAKPFGLRVRLKSFAVESHRLPQPCFLEGRVRVALERGR